MQLYAEILTEVRSYIADEVLEGEDVGLEAGTPLLQLGVLNSLEIVRLVDFIHQRFGVTVASAQIVADNFKDLDTIADLVGRLLEVQGSGVR